jgi:hypothetical protein
VGKNTAKILGEHLRTVQGFNNLLKKPDLHQANARLSSKDLEAPQLAATPGYKEFISAREPVCLVFPK